MTKSTTFYPLPDDGHKAWKGDTCQNYIARDEATKWQLAIAAAVHDAIDANGLFYSEDVYNHVVAIFNKGGWLNDQILSRNTDRVQRGDFGMEVYYARHALEQWQESDRIEELKGRFNVGDIFKKLYMNGSKFSKAEVLDSADPKNIKIRLTKRGSRNRWTATINAYRLQCVIDRSEKWAMA